MSRRIVLSASLLFLALAWSPNPMRGEDSKGDAALRKSSEFAPLPENITSFGAAILDGELYTYGGHTGSAHSYSREEQGNVLRRLSLDKPAAWETLLEGPHLQGLAMVAVDGKLVRIGGFTAKNAEGEDHDLWSQPTTAAYDPKGKNWSPLPDMPEPRSSFDAAVLDGKVYVVGGWKLQGEADSVWSETAYALDLQAGSPKWTALPKPPFQRRALAAAAHDGKLYAIGGMQKAGGPTTKVDCYDPKSKQWIQGPALPGKPMNGFGCSAFAVSGRLYVSTSEGDLLRLSDDGKSWKSMRKLEDARFFHRMLPLNARQLISVGGANMSSGKFDQAEVISVGR